MSATTRNRAFFSCLPKACARAAHALRACARSARPRGGAKRRAAALGAAQRREAPPQEAERRAAHKACSPKSQTKRLRIDREIENGKPRTVGTRDHDNRYKTRTVAQALKMSKKKLKYGVQCSAHQTRPPPHFPPSFPPPFLRPARWRSMAHSAKMASMALMA